MNYVNNLLILHSVSDIIKMFTARILDMDHNNNIFCFIEELSGAMSNEQDASCPRPLCSRCYLCDSSQLLESANNVTWRV